MRLLHVSDLHLGVEADFEQDTIINRFLEDVRRQATGVPFDLVVISGDLTASGQAAEFARVRELLTTPLLETLDLSALHLVATPGNHDIDRALVGTYEEAGLRDGLSSTCAVEVLLNDSVELAGAMRRLDAWRDFEESLLPASGAQRKDWLAATRSLDLRDGAARVVTLNSAWRATGAPNDEDRGHLLVSESHAVWALDAIANACRFVLSSCITPFIGWQIGITPRYD